MKRVGFQIWAGERANVGKSKGCEDYSKMKFVVHILVCVRYLFASLAGYLTMFA